MGGGGNDASFVSQPPNPSSLRPAIYPLSATSPLGREKIGIDAYITSRVLSIVGVAMCFIPIASDLQVARGIIETNKLVSAMDSGSSFRALAAAIFALCIPYILDSLLDILELYYAKIIKKMPLKQSAIELSDFLTPTKTERLFYVIGMALSSAVIFTQPKKSEEISPNLETKVVVCSIHATLLFSGTAVLRIVGRTERSVWKPAMIHFGTVMISISVILSNLLALVSVDEEALGHRSPSVKLALSVTTGFFCMATTTYFVAYLIVILVRSLKKRGIEHLLETLCCGLPILRIVAHTRRAFPSETSLRVSIIAPAAGRIRGATLDPQAKKNSKILCYVFVAAYLTVIVVKVSAIQLVGGYAAATSDTLSAYAGTVLATTLGLLLFDWRLRKWELLRAIVSIRHHLMLLNIHRSPRAVCSFGKSS